MLAAAWQRKLAEAGLAGVTWPKEFGGRGLGPIEQVTVNQEISPRRRAGDPRRDRDRDARARASSRTAPTSRRAATWDRCSTATRSGVRCSPSRPPARTWRRCRRARARTTTARWTLNGQKVWTTNAQFASFGLLLARTDPDVPKHKGLTMFIVPMDATGVTVRGLRQISGEAEFNEVFFDDVVLDEDAVVGGVGNGWGTALTVLMFERLTIGFGSESFGSPARLAETLAADPRRARATPRCASGSATSSPSCWRCASTATAR